MTSHDPAPDMVERVARSLYDRNRQWGDGSPSWAKATKEEREECLADARAAIEAMREPTDGMRFAFWDNEDPTDTGFQKGWSAAIDAALQKRERG